MFFFVETNHQIKVEQILKVLSYSLQNIGLQTRSFEKEKKTKQNKRASELIMPFTIFIIITQLMTYSCSVHSLKTVDSRVVDTIDFHMLISHH